MHYSILTLFFRDYRWYADDLIHPSTAAQKIILKRFSDCYFTDKALLAVKDIENLQNDINHRPSVSLIKSIAYKKHLEKTVEKIIKLQIIYKGYLNFQKEECIVKEKILIISHDEK